MKYTVGTHIIPEALHDSRHVVKKDGSIQSDTFQVPSLVVVVVVVVVVVGVVIGVVVGVAGSAKPTPGIVVDMFIDAVAAMIVTMINMFMVDAVGNLSFLYLS